MPGTTRYSATFDRTYEEDDRLGPPPTVNPRRSRSQSWQAHSGLDGNRPYTPLGIRPPAQRSSSTDNGPSNIPTRTVAATAVKAHNNPFQFVKVGTCPLYKKAEEQLKKTKEVKKQDVFREEEEEWQSNLDSWKSRRRKMSEDVFRRQEEIKQFELEEQEAQLAQKKTKTFSEMVESRAHRGRALSLCLISNPLEFQDWEFEKKSNANGSCSTFTDESEENSTVNSEDEGVSLRGRSGRPAHHDNQKNLRTNGDAHSEQNGSKLEAQNGDFNNVQIKPKEGSYIDSGLESISSSHRAGDTPDSGSDFSQDSNSSIDCESPRTGVNILEEFNTKTLQMSGEEHSVKLSLLDKAQGFGFQFQGGKDAGQVLITSVIKGSKAESCGVHVGDQLIRIEGLDVSPKTHAEIISLVQKGQEKGEINLLLWRHTKTTNGFNTEEKCVGSSLKPNKKDNQEGKSESQQYEKSIESENEMYVDDFEELQRQSELLTSSKTSETTCTNSQAQSNGKVSTVLSSDKEYIKSAPVPKLIEPVSNGANDRQNTNEKTDSEISTESPKKNIVKVKRVRRKGVYALDVSGTPNSIPQEGIPVGCLYPLSPVTELPSPADETKTISSTLSSNLTTPVPRSQNSIVPKETEIKLNSSSIKENNKTTASAPKSVISKTTGPSDESKINISEKVESKTESSSVPSSPTITKNKDISLECSVEEKPKIPSSPKKVKVKVKKANTSSEQKSPESSVAVKETPCNSVTQAPDLSVKKLTTESQPKKEQKSSTFTDDKSVKLNKNENQESLQKMESNISATESSVIKSDTLSSSSDKTSSIKVETSPENTKNLSLKIVASSESDNLAITPSVTGAKTPKTPIDEKSKPPFAPKKEKAKPKENNAGSTPAISEAKSISSKSKTTVTLNEASVDKTKNISLKAETQNESLHTAAASPVVSSKLPKTPQEEKAKPSLILKDKAKSKENSTPPVESAIGTKEVKSIELKDKIPVTSTDKNITLNNDAQKQTANLVPTPSILEVKLPKTPQEEKSNAPLAQKKEKASMENNSLTTVATINAQEAKSNSLKDKIAVTSSGSSPEKIRNLSLNIHEQDLSSNSAISPLLSNIKQPKTPQSDKAKPSFVQKKEKVKSKGKTPDLISPDSSQDTKETFIISITTCSSPAANFVQENPLIKELNSISDEMMVKTSNAKESAESSITMENGNQSEGNAIGTQESKVLNSSDKTSICSSVASSIKSKNLTLNIAAQNQSVDMVISPPVVVAKPPKTPQDEKSKPSFSQKKGRSKSKENNILSPETSIVPSEIKSTDLKEKLNSDNSENLALQVNSQKESIILDVTSSDINSKQPKTPQEEKTKPRLVRKRSKSKGKAVESNASSVVDKESSNNNLSCKHADTLTVECEPHKKQDSGPVANVQVVLLDERTKSSEARENNILPSGTSTVLEKTKSTGSKEIFVSSDNIKNLSLQDDAQKETITIEATPSVVNSKQPKTLQDEKTKPRLVRKRSKSKGKAIDHMPSDTIIVDKESASNSLLSTTAEASTKELHKEQNSESVADDIPMNLLNKSAELSNSREDNILCNETPAALSESTGSKKKPAAPNKNLSLKIETENECVTLDTTPTIDNNMKPKTPQNEKTKPRLVRKRSKSKGKAIDPMSSDTTVVVKESTSNPLPSTTAETSAPGKEPHKEQNSELIANDAPVSLLNKCTELSNSKENNILPNETPAAVPESTESKEKPAAPNKNRNLSLKIVPQNECVTLDTTPTVGNNMKPKTPQNENTKPRLARKRSKSKVKATDHMPSDTTVVDKESASNSLPSTTVETSAPGKEPRKEQNLESAANDAPENNVLSNETPAALPECTGSKEKPAALNKNRNLSLKIEPQNECVTLDTTSIVDNNMKPKTPQSEKSKPCLARKRSKSKVKNTEHSADPSQVDKNSSNNSISSTSVTETLSSSKETCEKPKIGSVAVLPNRLNENKELSKKRDNNDLTSVTPTALLKEISTSLKEENSVSSIISSAKGENLSVKVDKLNESMTTDMTPAVVNTKKPKIPQDEKAKPRFSQIKEKSKSKDKSAEKTPSDSFDVAKETSNSSPSIVSPTEKSTNKVLLKKKQNSVTKMTVNKLNNTESSKTMDNSSCAETAAILPVMKSTASKDKISVANIAMDFDKTRNQSVNSNQPLDTTVIPPVVNAKMPQTLADEKFIPFAQKKENTKPKNTNSQKVNSPAKQNEELMNLNIDSLNVIFQSEPKNSLSDNQSINNKNSENNSNKKAATDLVPDIPPVEKVAEEMEKLILEQLEEEERAKELASQQTKNSVGSPEHLLTAPPRKAEPPKEKPPPPPSANEGNQKDSSLKRVNSTKRIKKEIHKRRSNFLGIDNVDESIVCNEPSIPPPPALEEILKAEMELDRQSRLKIENASIERLTLEEKEIMQKEREIIESLECEERQKQLLDGTEDLKNVLPTTSSDVYEDDRILSLKNERKRIETERLITEEQQQLNLLEEKQLREREEFIRKQEAGKSAGSHSDSSLSVAANAPNNSPTISSLTETKPKVSLSDSYGDGGNVTSNSSAGVSENKSSDGKDKASEKPAVPPKPLKKKEAIRKERERLRQEQEALQKEREEHRRKLMLEQEELMKQQKSHAPDAPVTQLGPLPPLVPPNFPPQLTTTMNATPNARESASFPSRSHHGASNGTSGSINAVELMGPPTVRQNRLPASRKAVQNEAWGQQKMPSVRKQNHDSLTESRYNQNHWLIQEAEMRRISELKERQQRTTQLPCSQTHLAEDDVCSNPPRVPVITPTTNPHLNYAVQDKMWNCGQSSMPPKKYPPPVVKDPLHPVYPRETVSQQPPTKPSRVVPMERQEQMLSVSGRKRCSHCNEELGRGAAMIIESLQLYYHIHCFQCCVCQAQLGNGSCGTDVRVRNNKLHCHNCYSNDEAGLKFSQV